jgi:hypothetical protein
MPFTTGRGTARETHGSRPLRESKMTTAETLIPAEVVTVRGRFSDNETAAIAFIG